MSTRFQKRGEQMRTAWNRVVKILFCLCTVWEVLEAAQSHSTLSMNWLYPAGVQQGQQREVRFLGFQGSWPASVWCNNTNILFQPVKEKPGVYTVQVPAETDPGPYWIRAWTPRALGPWSLFLVEKSSVRVDALTTNSVQPHLLPGTSSVVYGLLEGTNRTDVWQVSLSEASELTLRAQAWALDVPLSLRVTVEDAAGQVLGETASTNHQDPPILHLRLGHGQFAVRVRAVEGEDGWPLKDEVSGPRPYRLEMTVMSLPSGSIEARIAEIGPMAQGMIRSQGFSNWIEPPATVHGMISPEGDRDRFGLQLRGGEQISIQVQAASIGSKLQPLVRIVNEAGAVLESQSGSDISLEWIAPADGTYAIEIQDARFQGGVDYFYTIQIGAPGPDVEGWVEPNTVWAKPGQTLSVTLSLQLPDWFQDALTCMGIRFPEGFELTPVLIAPGMSEIPLTISVPEEAQPGPYLVGWGLFSTVSAQTYSVQVRPVPRFASPDVLLLHELPGLWIQVLPDAAGP